MGRAISSFDMQDLQTKVFSSLYLQALIVCHRVWLGIFFVVSILLYIYKGLSLPYRNAGLGFELTFLVVYAMIDWGRLYLGSLGNLTETAKPLAVFVVLSLPLSLPTCFSSASKPTSSMLTRASTSLHSFSSVLKRFWAQAPCLSSPKHPPSRGSGSNISNRHQHQPTPTNTNQHQPTPTNTNQR